MKLPPWHSHTNKANLKRKGNRDTITPLKSFMLNQCNFERFQRSAEMLKKSHYITKASLFEPLVKNVADGGANGANSNEIEIESEAVPTECFSLFECICRIIFEDDFELTSEFSLKQRQASAFKILEFILKKQGKRNAKILATEQSMLYEKDITFEILQVICSYYKINIIYELEYVYHIIHENDEEDEQESSGNSFFLIKKEKKNFKISEKKKKILEKIEKKKIFLEKNLKNIGHYKLGELVEMAQKIGIATEKHNGKRRTKAELYEEIVLKLN